MNILIQKNIRLESPEELGIFCLYMRLSRFTLGQRQDLLLIVWSILRDSALSQYKILSEWFRRLN